MLKIKSILFVAVAGFIFSFLTGLLSGNPFTVILFRSFTGSIFFTVIVVTAVFVLKKALPEIDEIFSRKGEVLSGGNPAEDGLDVVIEDENPYTPADEESETSDIDEDKMLQKDFIEEVEEESIDDISILKEAEESGDPDDVIEVMDDSINGNSLPELDENVSFISGSSDSTDTRENDALNKLGVNADPGTMAKAIKTILKKDQKG